ncbi:MAG: hypothetical protein ISS19_14360 [Bacteroidales bacterium]|nr:hypothetical protein [Bacteroidales bacterium]
MSWKFRKRGLLVLGILALTLSGLAQTYTESKKITRSFPTNPDTRLDVSNKYGRIHLIPWKKDSVKVVVDLYVRSSSSKKLEKIMNTIDFEFTGTKYYIIASTNFGTKYPAFFSDLIELSESIIPSKNQVEIDYTVMVPSGMDINVSNKFGDIFIDDLKGNVSVSLSNGDLKINRLEGEASINHHFGKGIINYINNGRLTLSYSNLEIMESQQLTINSKSSEIRIDQVDILKTESRRDKYIVGQMNNLFGDSYFSDISVSRMDDEVNYSPSYGDFRIDSVGKGFSYINLNSDYSDIRMVFSKSSSFYLDIDYHPDVVLRIPDDLGNFERTNLDKERIRLSGMAGKSESSKRVEIAAPKKCIISINTRK